VPAPAVTVACARSVVTPARNRYSRIDTTPAMPAFDVPTSVIPVIVVPTTKMIGAVNTSCCAPVSVLFRVSALVVASRMYAPISVVPISTENADGATEIPFVAKRFGRVACPCTPVRAFPKMS